MTKITGETLGKPSGAGLDSIARLLLAIAPTDPRYLKPTPQDSHDPAERPRIRAARRLLSA